MQGTKIKWTDNTFNPWIGCTKVSEGCANCYAATQDHMRYSRTLGDGTKLKPISHWGKGAPRHLTKTWNDPLKWDRACEPTGDRQKVFCASLADVFDAEVPKAWRKNLWNLIRECRSLDWQLLTKRPENIERFLPDDWSMEDYGHVWLGATVENQKRADERVEILAAVPAAIHFLSAEPLLSAINFKTLEHIEWVIVGGESGHHARSMNLEWPLSIVEQCSENGVACFVKQLGRSPIVTSPDDDTAIPWPVSDPFGENLDEWPEELKLREFPELELVS